MIAAQDIADKMRFALDAENADHYGDAEDLVPAINSAVQWLTSVINATMGEKKLGEEIFRDLTYARVFRTSVNSRISLDVFPDEPWSLLAIYPKPNVGDTGAAFVPPSNTKESALDVSKYHIDSDTSCKRLTIEEWSLNKNTTAIRREIEIRPAVVNDSATVFYVKKPTPIPDLTGTIEFPDSVFSLIFNKALAYIAYKQGDNTTLNAVTTQDIGLLLRTIS